MALKYSPHRRYVSHYYSSGMSTSIKKLYQPSHCLCKEYHLVHHITLVLYIYVKKYHFIMQNPPNCLNMSGGNINYK